MTEPVLVSVVVASHRRDYIRGLMDRLVPQTGEQKRCEAIVVADYGDDGLAGQYPSVRWIFDQDRGIPAKRNRGIREAHGRIVAFIDDDCRPSAGWVSMGAAYLEAHPDEAGVEGATRIEASAGRFSALTEFRNLEKPGYRTNNIFYRRTVLESAGLFDERFTVQREDVDLAFTVLEQGMTIGYCANLTVEHLRRTDVKWDVLKNCWNRRFDPLLVKKHPRLYRKTVGSAWTGSIAAVLAAHVACAVSAVAAPRLLGWMVGLDLFVLAVAAGRKVLPLGGALAQYHRTLAAFGLSPVVLAAALVWGSVKFRRLALW